MILRIRVPDDVPDRDYLFFHDLETSKMMEKCVCVCVLDSSRIWNCHDFPTDFHDFPMIFPPGLLPRLETPGSHVVLDTPTEQLSLLRVEGQLELDLMAQDRDSRGSSISSIFRALGCSNDVYSTELY